MTISISIHSLFAFEAPVVPHAAFSWGIPRLRREPVSGTKTENALAMEAPTESAEISLDDLRNDRSAAWSAAYQELWRVAWIAAKRKLPYDSREQLEDLVSSVIGNEIVPQIVSPKQEAFVQARTFDDILNLTSRILGNRAIDEIRKRVRRPGESDIDKVPERETAINVDDPTAGRAEEVHLALSTLDERFRLVVEDFYFHELSTDEIAKKRGRPKGSICSDLFKARQMLGAALAGNLQ